MTKAERAAELKELRGRWEAMCNAYLERAGVDQRIDMRSYSEQGIDRTPERKMLPSEWRQESRRAQIIEFRQARAEIEESRQDVARLIPDMQAEIINLQAERQRREREAEQVRKDRESRRQKLLDLADALRGDREARINLSQVYAAAGYQLQERDGKRVWTYPPGDLREDRQAVYAAWNEWDTRRRERIAQIAQERAEEEQARQAIRQSRSGVETPSMLSDAIPRKKTPWREWREKTLTERYGEDMVARAVQEDWYIQMRPDLGGLNIVVTEPKGIRHEIVDGGDILRSEGDGIRDIPLMLELAKAKGWTSLHLEGSDAFREQAAIAAVQAGFALDDVALEQRAKQQLRQQREALERQRLAHEAEEAARAIREPRFGPEPHLISDAVRDTLGKRTSWQEWRGKTMKERYGSEMADRMFEENWSVRLRPDLGGWDIVARQGDTEIEIVDSGDILRGETGTPKEIPLMLDLAKAKGWTALNIEGSEAFRKQAAVAALEAGFDLADPELEQWAKQQSEEPEELEVLENEEAARLRAEEQER
ncbi:MAG: LPD7 domain-containing protein, partial [Acidithiobacillus sp.]